MNEESEWERQINASEITTSYKHASDACVRVRSSRQCTMNEIQRNGKGKKS